MVTDINVLCNGWDGRILGLIFAIKWFLFLLNDYIVCITAVQFGDKYTEMVIDGIFCYMVSEGTSFRPDRSIFTARPHCLQLV